ncbi:MAG: hypothetical protein DRJ69_04130 [Thermoprotei archaeon]|nr:MAG: hypothetical protein DRJ69_04130 [Thermoprotei archaeon]
MELPSGEVVVVEEAKRPRAVDGEQAIKTFEKLRSMGKRVVAVAVVGRYGFDRRDLGLIAQALRAECSKYKATPLILTPRRVVRIDSIEFVVDC